MYVYLWLSYLDYINGSDIGARSGVPAITGVDTRAIVTYLREQGSSLARITVGEEYDQDEDEAYVDPEGINLVRKVSTKSPYVSGSICRHCNRRC